MDSTGAFLAVVVGTNVVAPGVTGCEGEVAEGARVFPGYVGTVSPAGRMVNTIFV